MDLRAFVILSILEISSNLSKRMPIDFKQDLKKLGLDR